MGNEKSVISKVLSSNRPNPISQEKLYAESCKVGYNGSKGRLLEMAHTMDDAREIIGFRPQRGNIHANVWYFQAYGMRGGGQ